MIITIRSSEQNQRNNRILHRQLTKSNKILQIKPLTHQNQASNNNSYNNYRRRGRSIRSSERNGRNSRTIRSETIPDAIKSSGVRINGRRMIRSGVTKREIVVIVVVVVIVIVVSLRGHDLSETLSGGFGGDVLSAFDCGEAGGGGGGWTEPRVRVSRRHGRR